MSSSLRAARAAQSFHATGPKVSVRNLHITGPQAQSATALEFQNRMAGLRKKTERTPKAASGSSASFNTTRAFAKPKDSSPIDMVYMPSLANDAAGASHAGTDPGMIPIVLHNYNAAAAREVNPIHASEEVIVLKPEISTNSIPTEGQIMVLSEAEGGRTADNLGLMDATAEVEKAVGGVKKVWNGFLDDLLGEKKVSLA